MNFVLALAFISLLSALLGNQFLLLGSKATALRGETRGGDVFMATEEINRYFIEKGSYPASLTALASTAGYEHVKLKDAVAFNYKTTTTPLTNTAFQFHRVAVVGQDYREALTATDLFAAANNTCDSDSFDSASRWCGRKSDNWWVAESKESIADAVSRQRLLLIKTARKFALYYSANSAFPNSGGGIVTLSSLAGYAGSAGACSGAFSWSGIPLGCDDLFSVSGLPVSYRYTSSKNIDLVAETAFKTMAGDPITIIIPMDLP